MLSVESYGKLSDGRRLEITLGRTCRAAVAVQPAGDVALCGAAALEKAGVHGALRPEGTKGVDSEGLELATGERIKSDIKVWTSGIVGHDVVTHLQGLSIEKGKRIATDRYLACTGVSDIYAIGDCAAVPSGSDGLFLPATAQVARINRQSIYCAL